MTPTNESTKKPKRRWLSFSLRGVLLLVLVISLPMGLIGRDLYRYRVEQDIVLKIESAGSEVITSRFGINQWVQEDDIELPEYSMRQGLLVKLFGEGFYRRPIGVIIEHRDVDQVLEQISKLETIQFVAFKHSEFADASRNHISKMKNLISVSLEDTTIEADQLRQFLLLPHLRELDFSHIKLSDAQLEALTVSNSLEDLGLFDVSISNQGFNHLSKIRSLKSLNITVPNEVTEEGLCLLGNHSGLEELVLIHAPINDQCLQAFAKISTLRDLNITGSPDDVQFSSAGLNELSSLPYMEVLDLPFLSLTDDELQSIAHLRNLKKFCCLGTNITDQGIKHLIKLKTLESLRIQGAQLTMEGVRSLADSPSIRDIDLGGALKFTFPEQTSWNNGIPYAENRADYDRRRRGEVNKNGLTFAIQMSCVGGSYLPSQDPLATSAENPFASPIELPDNFADTIGDPFVPQGKDLAIE